MRIAGEIVQRRVKSFSEFIGDVDGRHAFFAMLLLFCLSKSQAVIAQESEVPDLARDPKFDTLLYLEDTLIAYHDTCTGSYSTSYKLYYWSILNEGKNNVSRQVEYLWGQSEPRDSILRQYQDSLSAINRDLNSYLAPMLSSCNAEYFEFYMWFTGRLIDLEIKLFVLMTPKELDAWKSMIRQENPELYPPCEFPAFPSNIVSDTLLLKNPVPYPSVLPGERPRFLPSPDYRIISSESI